MTQPVEIAEDLPVPLIEPALLQDSGPQDDYEEDADGHPV